MIIPDPDPDPSKTFRIRNPEKMLSIVLYIGFFFNPLQAYYYRRCCITSSRTLKLRVSCGVRWSPRRPRTRSSRVRASSPGAGGANQIHVHQAVFWSKIFSSMRLGGSTTIRYAGKTTLCHP